MNLYQVWDKNYEWCCYAFDVSRGRAKASVAEEFYQEYIDMRCKTIRKGLSLPEAPALAESPDAPLYPLVLQCGCKYEYEEWIE